MTHTYTDEFYDYIEAGAGISALAMIDALSRDIKINSVLDVGCGRGAWLGKWVKSGVEDVIGVDGDYVAKETLRFSEEKFRAVDLTSAMDLGRQFDLVQCLEVAEHLPQDAAVNLIKSLVRHGDVILFSAATPGQGGEFHINEQPLEFWRKIFAQFKYQPFDAIRPKLESNPRVMPWYKYNTILYANKAGKNKLSHDFANRLIDQNSKFPNTGSVSWKLRKLAIGLLPRSAVNWLAVANATHHSKRLKKLHEKNGN